MVNKAHTIFGAPQCSEYKVVPRPCLRPQLRGTDPLLLPQMQSHVNTGPVPLCSPREQIYPPPAADVFLASCSQKPDLCRNPQMPEGPPPGGETQKQKATVWCTRRILENPSRPAVSLGLSLEGSTLLNHKFLLCLLSPHGLRCSPFLSVGLNATAKGKDTEPQGGSMAKRRAIPFQGDSSGEGLAAWAGTTT